MTPQIQALLDQEWRTYQGLDWWVRGEYHKQLRKYQAGWESYKMFNGYALAAIAWYRREICDRSATPKQIMHELQKATKQEVKA